MFSTSKFYVIQDQKKRKEAERDMCMQTQICTVNFLQTKINSFLDFYDFILFFTRWFALGEGDDDDDDDERSCGFSYAKLTRERDDVLFFTPFPLADVESKYREKIKQEFIWLIN